MRKRRKKETKNTKGNEERNNQNEDNLRYSLPFAALWGSRRNTREYSPADELAAADSNSLLKAPLSRQYSTLDAEPDEASVPIKKKKQLIFQRAWL